MGRIFVMVIAVSGEGCTVGSKRGAGQNQCELEGERSGDEGAREAEAYEENR